MPSEKEIEYGAHTRVLCVFVGVRCAWVSSPSRPSSRHRTLRRRTECRLRGMGATREPRRSTCAAAESGSGEPSPGADAPGRQRSVTYDAWAGGWGGRKSAKQGMARRDGGLSGIGPERSRAKRDCERADKGGDVGPIGGFAVNRCAFPCASALPAPTGIAAGVDIHTGTWPTLSHG